MGDHFLDRTNNRNVIGISLAFEFDQVRMSGLDWLRTGVDTIQTCGVPIDHHGLVACQDPFLRMWILVEPYQNLSL